MDEGMEKRVRRGDGGAEVDNLSEERGAHTLGTHSARGHGTFQTEIINEFGKVTIS